MSVTIDYYFNSGKGLSELGREISSWLACSLEPYEGNEADLYDRFLAMEFSLRTAEDYENQGELDFQSYGYELGVRTSWSDADLRPIALPTMLTVAYVLHRRLSIVGMLVYDAQRLLARYEERTDAAGDRYLFDLVSGKAFDDFSRHLEDVQARLSRGR